MKFRGALVALLVLAMPALADVTLVGDVPNYEIRNLQSNLDRIWQHEKATYLYAANAQNLVPPEIGFFAFQREKEQTDWQSWQKDWIRENPSIWLDWTQISGLPAQALTKDWIDEHIDTIFPFPVTFLAFHYDHTNRIQISPAQTFLRFYVNNPYGFKEETVGYGFYVASHEMLHYVLENDGIPGRLHHCLFVSEKNGHSLMGDIAHYLIQEKISSSMVEKVGLESEQGMMPCDQLTPDEQAQVRQIMAESPLW